MGKTRVFVTGATGFVGRHLMNLFPATEYLVFGSSYPQEPYPSEKNLFHLDIRSARDVFEVIKVTRPKCLFHLAAVSNVRYSWEKKEETLETNIMGTYFLLEAVKKFVPDARVIFVSSSDVYGCPPSEQSSEEKLFSEGDSFRIVNPYAYSKVSGELLGDFYCRVENLDLLIVRPFPHTGPGQSSAFVCSDWARQLIQIERGVADPVIKVGNLDVRRDFTDVRDTVRAYFLLQERGRKGEVYNISSGKAVSLRIILEILLAFVSKKVTVEPDPGRLRKTDILFLAGNNRKLREETGWEPVIPLEQTLRDLVDYWRARP